MSSSPCLRRPRPSRCLTLVTTGKRIPAPTLVLLAEDPLCSRSWGRESGQNSGRGPAGDTPCCLLRGWEGTSCDSCHRRGAVTRQRPRAAAARVTEGQAARPPYRLSGPAPVPPKGVPVAAGAPGGSQLGGPQEQGDRALYPQPDGKDRIPRTKHQGGEREGRGQALGQVPGMTGAGPLWEAQLTGTSKLRHQWVPHSGDLAADRSAQGQRGTESEQAHPAQAPRLGCWWSGAPRETRD